MLGEKIRGLFRPSDDGPSNGNGNYTPDFGRPARPARPAVATEADRVSNGLRQFFENVRGGARLRILDLGGACQANVNFIAVQGHKLYTEDVLASLDQLIALRSKEPGSRNGLSSKFIQENLDFPAELFDGLLVWDTLEFLDDEVLAAAVGRIQTILKPGGTILSFFHTHAKGETVPVYRYQIRDHQTLHLQPRFTRPLPRAFNNRNLERLFGNFRSVKFFLAKDGLREVIVTR